MSVLPVILAPFTVMIRPLCPVITPSTVRKPCMG